jgi:lipopolysaccharide transport protein LptA
MRLRSSRWLGVLLLTVSVVQAADPPKPRGDATITSDELELVEGGAQTVFQGRVVLTQDPYVLTANRMVRARDTGIVEAFGNIKGTWIAEKGEKMQASGERGRYVPGKETVELWERAKLMRWETATDTAPVVVTAKYFIAYRAENIVLAKENVHMEQRPRVKAQSEFAKFDQNERMLHLWGGDRVRIWVEDGRGVGDFEAERARISLSPKGARLMDRVKGHVIPSKT